MMNISSIFVAFLENMNFNFECFDHFWMHIHMPILVNLDTAGPPILQFLGLEKVALTNFAHHNFFYLQ